MRLSRLFLIARGEDGIPTRLAAPQQHDSGQMAQQAEGVREDVTKPAKSRASAGIWTCASRRARRGSEYESVGANSKGGHTVFPKGEYVDGRAVR